MNRLQLMRDLHRDEGSVRHAYQDSEGLWTIGVGHLIDERRGGGISKDVERYILDEDVAAVVAALDIHMVWWRSMPEAAQRALANMVFNLGLNGVAGFKRMVSALERKDYAKAADEALDSKWATQVGERADRIADLYRECA